MNSRQKIEKIIFGTDTPAGKLFDIVLLVAILLSILTVILESTKPLQQNYGKILITAEWIFTILFTIEYIVRIWVVRKPFSYIFSFLGIIDLLSILPSYLSLIFIGSQYLTVVRAIRLLRVFRVFKLNHFMNQGQHIVSALKSSLSKIGVFLFALINIIVILGTVMYVVEGETNGFDSIPRSIYWAIVTVTTVGYGDISPQTPLGQLISSLIMIVGYSIIAVPTGIVSAEFVKQNQSDIKRCKYCQKEIKDEEAKFCSGCGKPLIP